MNQKKTEYTQYGSWDKLKNIVVLKWKKEGLLNGVENYIKYLLVAGY